MMVSCARYAQNGTQIAQPQSLPRKINSENERHATAVGSPTTKSSLFEVPHIFPSNEFKPINDPLVFLGVTQAVLGDLQMDRPDPCGVQAALFDGFPPRKIGNRRKHRRAFACLYEGAPSFDHVFGRKKFRVSFVLQVINHADGRRCRFGIGWGCEGTKQQVGVYASQ